MIRVGQKLYNARIHKSLTLEEIARVTKIRPNFLAAIERGEYDKLPSDAYATGFVRNYASYLGLPQKEILALYRREFAEKRHVKVLPDSLTKTEGFAFSRIYILRTFAMLVLALACLTAYLGFQYRAMFLSPTLSIESPKADARVKEDLVISGKADPSATVFVNDSAVSINEAGEFNKKVSLLTGKNSITVKAKNRFGRETIVSRRVTVVN